MIYLLRKVQNDLETKHIFSCLTETFLGREILLCFCVKRLQNDANENVALSRVKAISQTAKFGLCGAHKNLLVRTCLHNFGMDVPCNFHASFSDFLLHRPPSFRAYILSEWAIVKFSADLKQTKYSLHMKM